MASGLATRWSFADRCLQAMRFRKVARLIPRGSVVADLGCGDGEFLRHIQDGIVMGYGIDSRVSDSKDQNCIFIRGQLDHKIPMEDNSVDVITSLALLEHLRNPSVFVKEILRVLRPSGRCILTTPSPRAKPLLEFLAYRMKIISEQDIRDHKRYYTDDELQSMLSEFVMVEISYFQFGFNTLVFAMKRSIEKEIPR